MRRVATAHRTAGVAALAVALAAPLLVRAQATPAVPLPAPTPSACVVPADVTPLHLYGLWRAEFDGLAQGATVLLEKHRELSGSFSGAINRDGEKAQLAGDVDEGEFTMEESVDGTHIAATWTGAVTTASCGREIRGSWQRAQDSAPRGFVLRKQAGWD